MYSITGFNLIMNLWVIITAAACEGGANAGSRSGNTAHQPSGPRGEDPTSEALHEVNVRKTHLGSTVIKPPLKACKAVYSVTNCQIVFSTAHLHSDPTNHV